MLDAIWISFVVIFIAELGDKSQLMALTLSTRYKPLPILAGITVATAVVHAFSVLIGAAFGLALPTNVIAIVAGIAFLIFAAWTFRGDKLTDDDEAAVAKAKRSAFMTAVIIFFLAELGDKTMLATITLATREGLFGTWLGSTVGMVAADALAIAIGAALGKKLPEKFIRYAASASFVIFGLILLFEGITA